MTVASVEWCPLNGAHYLHAQKSSRIPRRFIFFDTEAHRDPIPGGESQRWRLGCAAYVKWREVSRSWSPVEPVRYNTQDELIDGITEWSRKDARTVVVAHNLAYDLRISGLLPGLLVRGWKIEKPTFTSQHVSFEAVQQSRRLVFVDSLSVVPASLATVGGWLGMPKLPLPDEDDTAEAWFARCETDVGILARAYMAVINFLHEGDLGGWGRTGASIGWHTLLRKHLTTKVLVHGRSDVRAAEASAMYAGRAEVWRHGVQAPGPFYEWDYKMAYGAVCRDTALPSMLIDEVRGVSLSRVRAGGDSTRWLIECDADCPVPILPTSDDAGIFWPTGRLRGWWWETELLCAEQAGADITPRRAYRYRSAPWLASWAQWAWDVAEDDSTPEARVIGRVAKQWLRTIPGRTAMRYKSWEDRGAAWSPGVSYMPLLDLTTGDRGAALQLGDQRWEAWSSEWWGEALPQVLSYVMAETRVRLWQAMTVAGMENIVYVDTDCLIVTRTGHDRLSKSVPNGHLGSLRFKQQHRLLELVAPQLIEGSTYRRLSGVPRGARRTSQSAYDAEVWEGLTTSMAEGHPDRVIVRNAGFDIKGVDLRRLHLPGGATAPFTVQDGIRWPALESRSPSPRPPVPSSQSISRRGDLQACS